MYASPALIDQKFTLEPLILPLPALVPGAALRDVRTDMGAAHRERVFAHIQLGLRVLAEYGVVDRFSVSR